MAEEAMSEAHVSAECPQAGEATRVPSSDVGSCRPSGDPSSPSEGPRPAVGLSARIGDRSTFLALRRDGVRFRRGPLTLVYLLDSGPTARVAYVVSRRVGNAVVRNRVKRRLRAAVAQISASGMRVMPGAYLFVTSPATVDRSWNALTSDVAVLVAKAQRHCETGVAR